MKLALATIILLASSVSHADWTNGYTRSNGTYVQGYHHTHADGNPYNNYSTQGNTNPYTGQAGHVQPQQYGVPRQDFYNLHPTFGQ